MNIIPQSVTFVVDIRGVDEETIMTQYYSLLADLDKMSLESGLTYDVENLLYAEPVRNGRWTLGVLQHDQVCRRGRVPLGQGRYSL